MVDNGDGWWLVLLPDFKSACRDAERSEVCSIRTHPRHNRGSRFEHHAKGGNNLYLRSLPILAKTWNQLI